MTNATKIFKSRDSATAALRKIGIESSDYTLYIEKHKDGFECFIGEAEQAMGLEPTAQPVAKAAKGKAQKTQKTEAKVVKTIKVEPTKNETTTWPERVHAHEHLESIGVRAEDTTRFIEKTKQGHMTLNWKAKEWVDNGHKAPAQKKRTDLEISISRASKAQVAGVSKEVFAEDVKKAVTTDKKRGPQLNRKLEGASCMAVQRRLILEGKTNNEVWAIIQPQFSMPDTKKYYPGWTRWSMKKEGLIA